MSPTELRDYVAVMREMGVTTFKDSGLEIVLGVAPAGPASTAQKAPQHTSYEKLLFAATEGLPDEPE